MYVGIDIEKAITCSDVDGKACVHYPNTVHRQFDEALKLHTMWMYILE